MCVLFLPRHGKYYAFQVAYVGNPCMSLLAQLILTIIVVVFDDIDCSHLSYVTKSLGGY